MSGRAFLALTPFGIVALAAVALLAASDQDPVHDNEVTALGPEQPGVSPGPTHRPGQPCLVCHGGSGPASQQFAAAGTVYPWQSGSTAALTGVTVTLNATHDSIATATTNEVGNFYVLESQWVPAFPVHVQLAYQSNSLSMTTHIGRDGSCATCHFDPPGPETPGHVYVNFGSPDGGP